MLRRFNTGWNDGKYTVPGGHIEENETATEATIREAHEEAGITVERRNLTMFHVMHRKSKQTNGMLEYVDFFFIAKSWEGKPYNAEPDKCDKVEWFDLNNLPNNMLSYVKDAVKYYNGATTFSEFGWD